ncbi:MAG: hypothetical protein J0L75_18630 [Spirochaetes bacterium]|nr:hypothetical protein [Spirochaetota bacterium]
MRGRIFLLILANLLAVFIVLFFLDWFDIWNGYTRLLASVGKVAFRSSIVRSEDVSLLEREEQAKLMESFNIREADLKKYESSLKSREDDLTKKSAALVGERESLEAQKKKIAGDKATTVAYDKKVAELSDRLYNMPPDKAVERLLELKDDLLILDVLKGIDAVAASKSQASVVPYLYSLMPKEDAARLLRLSTINE